MVLGPKGQMLALEITPRVIRAMEFVPGTKPLRVTRAAMTERPGGEPVHVGRFLREFLQSNGFTAKRAVVGYVGPLIEHRIYAIPPATPETREALLRGKVAEEISTPISELRVSGEVIGKVTERGFERQEVMAVFTPEFEIRRLIFLLVEAGLTAARVTSVPLALAALHPGDAHGPVGFVHADPMRSVLGVSDDGKLRFAREFSTEVPGVGGPAPEVPDYKVLDLGKESAPEASPAQSEEEAVAERTVTELTRSLLYYRQLSRGATVSRIYWSGIQPSATVTRLIGERLRIEIALHPVETVATCEGGWGGPAAVYGVPVGLAVAAEERDRVNLLPVEYLLRKERRGKYLAVAAMGLAFLAANIGLYQGLNNASGRYRDTLAGVSSGTHLNAAMREDFARWVSLRKAMQEASASEQALKTPFLRWKALFASLGAPVPEEMTFSALSVERAGEGYRGDLKGKVRGKSPAEAQERMNRFLAGVRAGKVLYDLQYAPHEIRPMGGDEGKGYEQEFRMTFSMGPQEG